MKRIALLLPALLPLAGCPEREPEVLSITSAVRPETGCVFATGGTNYQRGIVDLVLSSDGYIAGFEVSNLLPTSLLVSGLNAEAGQLEANGIQLTGALISYRVPDEITVSLPDHFVPLGRVVDPSADDIALVEALPPQIADRLRTDPFFIGERLIEDPLVKSCLETVSQDGEAPRLRNIPLVGRSIDIVLNIQLEGITLAGNEVLSNDFQFSIQVCTGCLVSPGADSTNYLLARESGASFCAVDQGAQCRRGTDGCEEQVFCVDRYNNTDASISEKLLKCAEDTTFPAAALSFGYHPLCKDMPLDPALINQRYQHLACRYGLEKANAFCASDAAPLFEPQ